jgi:murein DD-endopeptidase MepM/ murein hydrolase activator NlpD
MTSAFGTARLYEGAEDFSRFHSGVDFGGPAGKPIYAPAAGVIVDTGFLDVRGLITIIDHGSGVYSGFWHQSSVSVEPGDFVEAGQLIGTVGNSGLSTAAHLHWELWVNGVQVDPLQWVRQPFP